MPDQITKLQFDGTMSNQDNYVPNEQHAAAPLIVARQGGYFERSLVITQAGRRLIKGSDYRIAAYSQKASKEVGQAVAYAVVIMTGSSAPIILNYHAVGGIWASYTDVMIDMLNEINLVDDIIYASDIVGMPTVFPPAPHKTHGDNLVGLERVVEMQARIVDAIITGNPAKMEALTRAIDGKVDAVNGVRLNTAENAVRLTSAVGTATTHDFTVPRSESEDNTVIVEMTFVGDEGVINASISYTESPSGITNVQHNATGFSGASTAQFAVSKGNGNRTVIRLVNDATVKSFKDVFIKNVMSTDTESDYRSTAWLTQPSPVDFTLVSFT